MTRLEAALLEVTALLNDLDLRYMLIGGLAVASWGEPRATRDVDLTVWVEPDQFEASVSKLASRLTVRTAQPLEFARRARVPPVKASNGVPVDLVFPLGLWRSRPSSRRWSGALPALRCEWPGLTTCFC